jgi:DNA invertase Pin-like site-specific DNA recombinase
MRRRVAGYVRVSTDEQTTALQVDALRVWAERAGVDLELFVDEGWSGAKDRRPALDDMLGRMRRREFGAVAVWRLDRLARSLAHLAKLGEDCQALGVELVSLTEGIDTTTPTGRAMFGMCGVFAQLERDLIVQRTQAGLEAARKRGTTCNRPRTVNVAKKRARACRMRAAGQPLSAIADVLGCSVSSVHRMLKDAAGAAS